MNDNIKRKGLNLLKISYANKANIFKQGRTKQFSPRKVYAKIYKQVHRITCNNWKWGNLCLKQIKIQSILIWKVAYHIFIVIKILHKSFEKRKLSLSANNYEKIGWNISFNPFEKNNQILSQKFIDEIHK